MDWKVVAEILMSAGKYAQERANVAMKEGNREGSMVADTAGLVLQCLGEAIEAGRQVGQ